MVTLEVLWLPILVAAGLVFVASNIVWMVLPHHRSDAQRLSDEPPVLEALHKLDLAPGLYRFPWAKDMKEMKEPGFVEKLRRGPVGFLTITPSGPYNMGKPMLAWVLYILAMSLMVAYIAGKTLPVGTSYRHVFRLVGAMAILGYAGANPPAAIWWGKPWANAWKEVADGILYGLLTAGAFGWLWPR